MLCIGISGLMTWHNIRNASKSLEFKRIASSAARNSWRVADTIGIVAIILAFPLFGPIGRPNLLDLITSIGLLLFGTWIIPILIITYKEKAVEVNSERNSLRK